MSELDALSAARVAVLGGAGFVGSHLCDRLLGLGAEVVCVDNLMTGTPSNLRHIDDTRFSLIRHDIREHIEIDGVIDYVLNFASPASPVNFERWPIQILKIGSMGTHNALGLAMAKGAVFMQASTSEVYGDPLVNPQPEDYWGNVNPIGVRGVYDEGKRYAEALTMAYHRAHGVSTRIVRIFNTYGPRMRPDDGRAVPAFFAAALQDRPIPVHGDGLQTRSLCHVDDLIEGILRLAVSSVVDPVNVGNPHEVTILELAQTIQEVVGSDRGVEYQPRPTDDPNVRCPDITRAKTLLGWKPIIGLREGLEQIGRAHV